MATKEGSAEGDFSFRRRLYRERDANDNRRRKRRSTFSNAGGDGQKKERPRARLILDAAVDQFYDSGDRCRHFLAMGAGDQALSSGMGKGKKVERG